MSSPLRVSDPTTALDAAAAELGPGGELAPERDAEAYRRRMARRREVQQQRVGERNVEKGLVLVFTGDGKGKTTAALGLVLRTLGHGEQVAVVQFIKGGWQPGEAKALELFGDALAWHALGEGFTWETQDRDRDRELVQAAWQRSCTYLADGARKLVVLDEVNVALKLGYLAVEQVLEGLARGWTNKQIAQEIEIAATTVRDYVGTLCRKLDAANRTEALSRAIALGLVHPRG